MTFMEEIQKKIRAVIDKSETEVTPLPKEKPKKKVHKPDVKDYEDGPPMIPKKPKPLSDSRYRPVLGNSQGSKEGCFNINGKIVKGFKTEENKMMEKDIQRMIDKYYK